MFGLFHVFGLFIIIIFSSSSNIVLLSATTNCQSSTTCNGVEFRYPFWVNSSSPEYCGGYPGFGVSNCTLESPYPVLNVLNDLYYLLFLDHGSQYLRVSKVDLWDQACPRPRSNFTLSNSNSNSNLVQLALDPFTKYVSLFYNCSSYPPNSTDISCLNTTNTRSFAFFEDNIPEFDWYGNCQETVEIPTELDSADFLTQDYSRIYQNGFQLRWSPPNYKCRDCERSGGKCWYNQTAGNDFRCLCDDDGTLLQLDYCSTNIGSNLTAPNQSYHSRSRGAPILEKTNTRV